MSILSSQEKEFRGLVRTICEERRQGLIKARNRYVRKDTLVRSVHNRVAQLAKKRDPKDGLLISMLPRTIPGYWMLIERGIRNFIDAELQRHEGGLPLWESYYSGGHFCWIPRAIINASQAEQISRERADMKARVDAMSQVYAYVAEQLKGTSKLFSDIEDEIMPEIQKILRNAA